MSITKTKSTKLVLGIMGFTLALAMFVGVGVQTAGAASLTDAQVQSILSLLSSFGADQSVINNVQASLTGSAPSGGTPPAVGTYNFTRSLTVGATGDDVKELQKFLNANGFQVSVSGAGAPGSESSYFGPATRAALAKYQAANNISPAVGYFGPLTRTSVNGTVGGGGVVGGGGGVVVPVGDSLAISLASDSPASGAIISGQAIADLGHFTFSNQTNTEATVTSVTLQRTGISSDSTLSNVYLFSGQTRITDAATVSLGKITLNNAAGLFKIPARSAVTIAVRADIAASTAGQIIGVALESVVASAPISGTLPVSAATQSIATASMGTVVFTYTGPSAATDNPATDVRVFEASTVVSTHKASVKALTFENRGTTKDGDLVNLRLFIDGVQVGSPVASFVADRATFDLSANPVLLDTGTRIIKVLADIVGGSSYTYDVQLRKSADVVILDSELGQPILATTFAVAAGTANTIAAGTLSISRSTDSPSSNISVGSTNVKFASFDFRAAGEDIKIETITVDVDTTGTTGTASGIDNAKVFVNGSQIGSTGDVAAGGTEFAFGSSFIAKAGALTKVEIYADAKTSTSTNFADGSTVDIGVSVAAADTEGLNSGNTVTAVAEVEGFSRTISASSLTATKYSGYGDQTLIAGTNSAKLGSFTLSAGSTEGVNVNTIVVNLSANEAASVTDLMLKDTSSGAQIGSTKPSPSTDNTFSVNFSIPASGTKTIDIYANIKSGSNAGPWIATIDETTGGTGATTAQSTTLDANGTADTGSDLNLQTITVGSGTLTTAVGTNLNNRNVVAGSSNVKVGTFKFTAQYSDFTVSKVNVKIPADAATSVSSVTLKWNGGEATQALALSSSAQTYATSTFTGLSFTIPQNTERNLDVYVSIPTIASGASTGKAISVVLDGNEGYEARDSAGTATTTLTNATDLASTATSGKGTVYVRQSIPTLSSSPVSGTLVAGSNRAIGNVTVTADAAGAIGWKKISFTVAKTAALTTGATTTIALWDGNNQVAGVFGTTTGDLVGGLDSLENSTSGNFTFVATSEQEIAAGQSKTYQLRTTIGAMAAGVANDSIDVSIANPSTSITTGTATGVAADTVASTPSFGWTDRSSISTIHSESTSDWTDDYLVTTLPLSIGNLHD